MTSPSHLGRLCLPGILASFTLLPWQTGQADVIINEISAASSERVLRFDDQDRPRLGAGLGWMDPGFDQSYWKTGSQPFGFGAGKATDLREEMQGVTPSLYLRKTFTVSADVAALRKHFLVKAKFDDAFVAYVNGVEIGRANLGRENGFVYADQTSLNEISSSDANKTHLIAGPWADEILVEGENVFAVQVHNTVPEALDEDELNDDRTLHFEAELTLGLGIFQGEPSTKIPFDNDDYSYFVGVVEPSGGLFDHELIGTNVFKNGFSDWIELHNNGAEAVSLAGWSLSDDRDVPDMWTFPKEIKIAAGGYLVVLADDLGDSGTAGAFLHTNFKLAADGDDVLLYNGAGELVSELNNFPSQNSFHSYGTSTTGADFVYHSMPSPGTANAGDEFIDVVKSPKFSVSRGFYSEAVDLELTTATEDAEIRFTMDGSEPTLWNGEVYNGVIKIAAIDNKTGTVIRAAAFKDGMIASKIKTHTYLIDQHESFQDVPTISLVGDAGKTFYAPHGVMTVEGGAGLGDSWRATDIQDYYMPYGHGRPFERKASMELIYPDEDGENIQLEAGLRLAASDWSRGRFRLNETEKSPWTSNAAHKPSFNLFFRNEYGDEELDFPLVKNYRVRKFDQLRLRAGKNDIRNPWIKDELARRLFGDTGQLSSQGIQSAVFVNGAYKGYYNTVARLRTTLFQEYYGTSEPWDIKHIRSWTEGDDTFYEQAVDLLEKDLDNLENYQAALAMVDPVNIADYLIVNTYGATWDWPHNNFVMARERSETGKWRMYLWDAEGVFGQSGDHGQTRKVIQTDILDNSRVNATNKNIVEVSQLLMESSEFRLLFADRLQKHFFSPDGALTEDNAIRRMEELADEIEGLMRFSGNGAPNLGVVRSWIEKREKELFSKGHFTDVGLWPDTQAPAFRKHGGTVAAGFEAKLSAGTIFNPQDGDIIYTTDGSDPRLMGGAVNPEAKVYVTAEPIVLTEATTVHARVKNGDDWSAITSADFLVDLIPATSESFVISEIMYDPAAPSEAELAAGHSKSDFEYIEIYNASETAIDLSDLSLIEGVRFDFNSGSLLSLAPQSYAVIVADIEAFQMRYGTTAPIAGRFGKSLNNDGETIEVTTPLGETIKKLTYADRAPWPAEADGDGFSLELVGPGDNPDPNDAGNWVASAVEGGSPGAASGEGGGGGDNTYETWKVAHFSADELGNEAISGPNGDPDGDSQTNLLEFAAGTLPKDLHSVSSLNVADDAGHVTIILTRGNDVSGIADVLEWATDLNVFTDASASFSVQSQEDVGDDVSRITYRSNETREMLGDDVGFVRRRVDLQ